MRLTRVFFFLVILGSSAAATYAQTDPIIYNNEPAGPSCSSPDGLIVVTASSDVTVTVNESFSDPISIIYCPTTPSGNLASIIEDFNGVPAGVTLFGCQSNIWQDCELSGPSDGTEEVYLYGTAGECQNDDQEDTCTGLAPGAVDDVTISPEPNSMILFGTGLILLFVASKRHFHTCANLNCLIRS
jgi:hypothetical protein